MIAGRLAFAKFAVTWLKFKCCRAGAAALEFALVMVPLFGLIFGIIEFGLIWHVGSLVEDAAHYAARLGRTGNSYSDLNKDNLSQVEFFRKVMSDRLAGWVKEPSQLTIDVEAVGDITNIQNATSGSFQTGSGGQAVVYNVTYHWDFILPFFSNIVGEDGRFPITSRVAVVNEDF